MTSDQKSPSEKIESGVKKKKERKRRQKKVSEGQGNYCGQEDHLSFRKATSGFPKGTIKKEGDTGES